jgi:hypothetical protein
MILKKKNNVPAKAMDLYRASTHISKQQRKYHYGGGHGWLLRLIKPNMGLDCSSSTSLALSRAGMWPAKFQGRPIVSGNFDQWGAPGRGKYFTIWFNARHVWIQFHGIGRFWRFDTSAWGSGGHGPRMRLTPRPTYGFSSRHWPGL